MITTKERYSGYLDGYINHKICMEAVKNNGHALKFVKNQTLEICMEAVKNDREALKYISDPCHRELCEDMLMEMGMLIDMDMVNAGEEAGTYNDPREEEDFEEEL